MTTHKDLIAKEDWKEEKGKMVRMAGLTKFEKLLLKLTMWLNLSGRAYSWYPPALNVLGTLRDLGEPTANRVYQCHKRRNWGSKGRSPSLKEQ